MLTEEKIVFTSHAPKADLYDGNPAGSYVHTRAGEKVQFVLQQITAGTNTGTATVTVLAASAAAGTGAEAVPFRWRKKNTGVTVDAYGAVNEASTTGFVTTANESTLFEIEVDATNLPDGKPWCALKLTETVNDPVNGAVIGLVHNPRHQGLNIPGALA